MLFVPFLVFGSHTSFRRPQSLEFCIRVSDGRLDDNESSSGLCGDCSIGAFRMSEIAIGPERSSIWDCISSKHGYEGNAAFQIGKDGETEERHERRFRFLNVVVGCYAGFSVYKREADGPMGMH